MKHIKLFEEFKNLNEGRSIEKIQYDWAKLTTQMQATAANWKAAEGKAKDMLLGKLKDMTAKKKQLEAELDSAISDKDKDLELVIREGTFYRLPKDVIGNELYVANQSMSSLYSGASAGDDISPKEIDYIIKLLQQVKSLTKKFNNADDVIGTVYEKLNVDIVAKKWDELYGEDLKDDYYDIWKKLKAKGSFTLSDLEKMWNASYGESFKDAYDGLYQELMNESLVTEGKIDANYWEDYQEGAEKTKNPTSMQIMQDVQAAVEDWNDNNEMGKENEVTPAGEKKVLKLAKEFVKAKGWISFDIIDAMIAQES